MEKLIAGTFVVCVTVVLVAVATIRHENHKHDVAWCYAHGYAMPPKTVSASEQPENSSKFVSNSLQEEPFPQLRGPFRSHQFFISLVLSRSAS